MLNPYQQYANSQVNTAPPEELTLMLYKGTIKFISLAIRALDEKNFEQVNENIIRAQDIYSELLTTLNPEYPISKELSRLYDFMLYLLREANVAKDKALMKQALELSREFTETWEEAIKIYRRLQAPKQAGQTG